jgi:hypothetical protein
MHAWIYGNHLFSEREDGARSIDNTGAHLVNSRTSCTDNTMVGILLFSSADADCISIDLVGILHKKLKRKVDRRFDFAWTRIDLALDAVIIFDSERTASLARHRSEAVLDDGAAGQAVSCGSSSSGGGAKGGGNCAAAAAAGGSGACRRLHARQRAARFRLSGGTLFLGP